MGAASPLFRYAAAGNFSCIYATYRPISKKTILAACLLLFYRLETPAPGRSITAEVLRSVTCLTSDNSASP
jgi:hypothetical protein